MHLFIIRHGKAKHDSDTGRDSDRPLAQKGQLQAQWLGRELASRIGAPALMLSSPVLRARTTAEIIHESLQCVLEHDERLSTDGDAHTTLEAIDAAFEEHQGLGTLLIVGHNPHFGHVANLLAGAAARVGELRTGECIVLEVPGSGRKAACTFLERLRFEHDD